MVKALWHTACNKNMALHPFPALYNANPQNKEGWQWRSQISVITGALGGVVTCYHKVNFDPSLRQCSSHLVLVFAAKVDGQRS